MKKADSALAAFEISERDLLADLQSSEHRGTAGSPPARLARIGYGQLGTVRARGRWWRLQYRAERDASGHRPQLSIQIGERASMSYEQARALATRTMDELAPRRVAPGSTCGWDLWCDRFVSVYLPNLRRGSRNTIGSIIRAHVRPAFADLQIHEIRTARVQTWIASMRSRGAAPETIASRYRVLRRLLRRARAEGLAAEVPTAGDVDLPCSDRPPSSTLVFTTEELRRILTAASEPWLTLYMLLAFCGLRIGEALGLRWCDLDLDAGRLSITQQAVGKREAATKTASSVAQRRIPPRLLEHLRASTAMRRAGKGLLFPSPRGGPYDAGGLRRRHLKPLLAQLEIAGKSFHSFRRWFGSAANRSGAATFTAMRAMRHTDVRATQRYVDVSTTEVDQAIERIEESCYPFAADDVLSVSGRRNDENDDNCEALQ